MWDEGAGIPPSPRVEALGNHLPTCCPLRRRLPSIVPGAPGRLEPPRYGANHQGDEAEQRREKRSNQDEASPLPELDASRYPDRMAIGRSRPRPRFNRPEDQADCHPERHDTPLPSLHMSES